MRMLAVLLLLLGTAAAKKKDLTQVLELPKEPPAATVGETRYLVFHVSPLIAKGLLSQQIREGMKSLLKENAGAAIIRVRAFVAGTGDMRRVPALVSEIMTDKKLALPAVSVVQVGGLPMEGAQVVLESISVSKKEVNPGGLLFVGGQEAALAQPLQPVLPLAEQALARLDGVLSGSQAVRVTCFTSSTEEALKLQAVVSRRYPQAAVDVVTVQRAMARSLVNCEATARLPQREFKVNGREATPVLAQRIAFTGTQLAFGFEENDARLAFQRIEKALEPLGASTKTVAMANFYPLSGSIGEQVRKIRLEVFDPAAPPAFTLLPFEGLPSLDASFAVDVAAVVTKDVTKQLQK